MKKALSAIVVALVVLVLIYRVIGGTFDRAFWLGFLPGLIANLAILFIAVFVIDRMFQKERWAKLGQINTRQSQFVFFLSNRLAYWLMALLGRTNEAEIRNDKALNFEFAIAKIKAIDLAVAFHEGLQAADDAEAFVGGFVQKLNDGTEALSKALDGIYPRPDPGTKQLADDMPFSTGALEAFKGFLGAIKEANAQVGADQQLKPEAMSLLTEIAYSGPAGELQKIQRNIIELSERAKANRLFISLD